jgi:hypothetical protein
MAKRTRGSRRPGQRPRMERTQRAQHAAPTQATTPARPSTSLTAEEEARAAEIEATIVAEERAAEQAQRRGRERARGTEVVGRVRDAAPLAVRASEEYAYVRRDVLRIVRIGGALLLILAVLFVLIDVARVIRL